MKLKVNNIEYILSKHAKHRMDKRKVSMDDLVEALTNPKYKRIQEKKGCESRYILAGRNKVTVVISLKNIIVTIYNYKKEYYASNDKCKRNQKSVKLKKKYGSRYKG